MDQTTPVILKVTTPQLNEVCIETSTGTRYFTDLSGFSKVYCYPKNIEEWKSVYIDRDGLGLIWSSRFEVHVDQVVALAHRSEEISHFSPQASV